MDQHLTIPSAALCLVALCLATSASWAADIPQPPTTPTAVVPTADSRGKAEQQTPPRRGRSSLEHLVLPQLGADVPEESDIVGEVTIASPPRARIYEYSINGQLYAIKVVPKWGKPYYLVPSDQNALDPTARQFLIPTWSFPIK